MQDVYSAFRIDWRIDRLSIRIDCSSDNRSPSMASQGSPSDFSTSSRFFLPSIRATTIFAVCERQCKGLLTAADGYMTYGTEQTNQRDMQSRFYFLICEMHIGLHIPGKENIKTVHCLENCWMTRE